MIYPGSRPAGVTTSSSRMITEYLLSRSMLIITYYHFIVCACIYTIVFTVNKFHVDVYLVYLVFQIALMFVQLFDNNSIRKHEYEFITTITIEFGESLQSKLSTSELLMLLYSNTESLSMHSVKAKLDGFELETGRSLSCILDHPGFPRMCVWTPILGSRRCVWTPNLGSRRYVWAPILGSRLCVWTEIF